MSDLQDLVNDFFDEMGFVVKQVQGTYLEDELVHRLEVAVRMLKGKT